MILALLAEVKEMQDRVPGGPWLTGGGLTLVAFLAGMAWASGVVKQLVNMLALAVAVGVAWWVFRHKFYIFGSSATVSMDRLLIFSIGLGILAYSLTRGALSIIGGLGVIKLAGLAGWKGMLLSLLPSTFLLWVSSMSVRFLGNVYGMEAAAQPLKEGEERGWSLGEFFTKTRQVIDSSTLGTALNTVDPLSIQRTGNLARLLIVWPDQRLWPSLAADRNTGRVFSHPMVAALGHDSAVRSCIDKKDYAGLLQLPQVEQAAEHPELENLLTSSELELSMDRILYGRPRR